MPDALLEIRGLSVDYVTERGPVRAVDSVSLAVRPGEVLGIAGESGSGKSTLAHALLRTLPPPAVISGGQVLFEGRDLLALGEEELRALRWKRMAIVFQSAMDSLNPVLTVGEQIEDVLRAHSGATRAEARRRARELLSMVEINPRRIGAYSHQLSGGMRQRVAIALALALDPALVILDEPTTALDMILEKEILRQVRSLQARIGFAVLFITHDLARMLEVSDRVAVFYAARLVELGPSEVIAHAPRHPYTQGLLRAFPRIRGSRAQSTSIPGSPPSLLDPPSGCRFHPRCAIAIPSCKERVPEWIEVGPDHFVACPLAR